MANRRRKKSGVRRQGNEARVSPAAIVGVFFIIALIVYGIVSVNRHIKGYFVSTREAGRIAAASPTATPEASAEPSPLSPGQASTAPSPAASGARLAIIIDDCGYSLERCQKFLALPIPITLSILPQTPHGTELANDALAAGKYVMLHLPMEADSPQAHPGPGAITTQMSDQQVQTQVEADLDSLPAMPGANNHMGSKASSDPRVMRDVLDVFAKRHLFFIDSLTSGSSVGSSTARELGIPTADRDVFLDNQKDQPYIEGQLKVAQGIALKNGSAIAIGHPNESTALALAVQIPKIEAAGVTFVSAESLVK